MAESVVSDHVSDSNDDDDDDDDDGGGGGDDVGKQLEPECAAELKEVRRSLLEDYRISPSVEQHCAADVSAHCPGVMQHDVIHCLMDVVRRQYRTADTGPHDDAGKRLSEACHVEVCNTVSVCLN